MRARSAFFAGAGSVAILAIGWQAGVGTLVSSLPTSAPVASGTTASAGTTTAGSSTGTASTGTASQASTSPAASPAAPVAGGAADGTYDGQVINTRFGTVQVQAVIAGGSITDVIAVKLTDQGRQSVSISNQAAPMVRQEVLAAQSARVSNIGGATYTTQAYLQSLQSALDAAGFTG
jgi:uncharacterized protein with FMN-binding domain